MQFFGGQPKAWQGFFGCNPSRFHDFPSWPPRGPPISARFAEEQMRRGPWHPRFVWSTSIPPRATTARLVELTAAERLPDASRWKRTNRRSVTALAKQLAASISTHAGEAGLTDALGALGLRLPAVEAWQDALWQDCKAGRRTGLWLLPRKAGRRALGEWLASMLARTQRLRSLADGMPALRAERVLRDRNSEVFTWQWI